MLILNILLLFREALIIRPFLGKTGSSGRKKDFRREKRENFYT
jgi:hypothetical protein